jgi:probable phosphoglycerate mutase
MIRLAVVRHAATPWTEQRRMQGRTDVPLSPAGRAAAASWRLPAELAGWPMRCSPLARTRETAELLAAGRPVQDDPGLIEMGWGDWEGRSLAELDAQDPRFAVEAARGLDMTPPGGESPRMVQLRLKPWLAALKGPTVAVTHKGVIRALLGLATGWDFQGKPPVRLSWSAAHLFTVTDGMPAVDRINLALDPS